MGDIDYRKLRQGGVKTGVALIALVAGRGGVKETAEGLNETLDAANFDTQDEAPDAPTPAARRAAPSTADTPGAASSAAPSEASKYIKPPMP